MTPPLLACMVFVAHAYALPPRVLPSIQAVEGGATGMVHHNTDGSDDLGVMQVNTLWLPALARTSELTTDEVRDRLLTRPCYNVAAAGLILRTYLDETRGNLMRAVGDYHSHTPGLNLRYRVRVLRSAAALFRPAPVRRRSSGYLAIARFDSYRPRRMGRLRGCAYCAPPPGDGWRGYTWRYGFFP